MRRLMFGTSINRASTILSITPLIQRSCKREISIHINGLLSEAALGYNPETPPVYVRFYNNGRIYAKFNQLHLARDSFYIALKDANTHGKKDEVDLILKEIENIGILLQNEDASSQNKHKYSYSIITITSFAAGYFVKRQSKSP